VTRTIDTIDVSPGPKQRLHRLNAHRNISHQVRQSGVVWWVSHGEQHRIRL